MKSLKKVLSLLLTAMLLFGVLPMGSVMADDTSAVLTYANGWDWSDSLCYQNHIFVYASSSSSATPATIHGQGVGFLQWQNGIVFEYNEENGTWKVVVADFEADGVNEAESAKLGSNRFAVIFHDEAVVGQKDSYNYLINNAVLDAEFVLNGSISGLQSASGKISGYSLTLAVTEEEETPAIPEPETITVSGKLTYANGWNWSDSLCYQKQIFVYASTSSSATPATIHGQGVGFLQWQNGIVFEYNEENGTWKVIVADFEADGVNEAESTKLGSNRFAVIFHDEAVVGQEESFNFFKTYAAVDAEFALNCGVSTLQSASGAISDVTLSYTYVVEKTPSEPEQEPEEEPVTPSEPEQDIPTASTEYSVLTFVNGYAWSDSKPLENNIFLYASANASATVASINGQTFLGSLNGIILEYNESKGTWTVVLTDYEIDDVNLAESATLGSNRIAVIFHNDAAVGLADSYNFLMNNATVGAEFVLTGEITALQSVSGKIKNVYLSLGKLSFPEEEKTPVDTTVGTIQSTIGLYTSQSYPSASSGDTDGLSAVLYAPQSSTVGISTYINLAAINTSLYTSSDALAKQNIGCGIASDKNIDNAYLYLCLNSTNWSGDFGLIKRLGDEDWEIVTSEYKNSAWRWNAYAYSSDVTVTYNPDYVYTKWNVMDGLNVYYIKNSYSVKDLQLNLVYNNGTLTYSLCIGGVTIFSVSDTGSISNGKYGRAASITNSSTTSYGSSNYLYQLSGTLNGRAPAALTNVQFYDSYYYTTSGYNKLTLSTGSLWLYPCASSSAGYLVNTEGDPIVTCEEVTLTSGVVMDIIDIQNY